MNRVLTIVVPAYNMEKYLSTCLGSLLINDAELLRKLDVIVVNDGSRDRTSEIAYGFASRYPDVFRVVDKPNGHYGSCINAALVIAQGAYMRILDADDALETSVLEAYIRGVAASAARRVDVIISDTVCVDSVGQVKRKMEFPYIPKGDSLFADLPARISDEFNLQAPFAFRTEMLKRMNYRQTEGLPYTDSEWATLPFAHVRTIHYLPIPLYKYLVERDGQSMDMSILRKNYWMSARIALNCLQKVLNLHLPEGEANERYVMNRCEQMLLSTYSSALFTVSTRESDRKLAELDAELLNLSEAMYARVEQRGIAAKGCFPYVRIWRRHKSSRTFRFALLRSLHRTLLRGIRVVKRS